MKKSTQAALLSGLVLPGTGHLFLKRYVVGSVLVLASVGLTGRIIYLCVHAFNQLMTQLNVAELSLDPIALLAEVQTKWAAVMPNVAMPSMLLFAIWVFAIADSYRIGRVIDSDH